jgi:Holliday junction resolvase RusA-like endonuclease
MKFTVDIAPMPAVRMTQASMYKNTYAQRYLRYKTELGWKLRQNIDSPIQGAVQVNVVFYLPIPKTWKQDKRALAMQGKIRPTSKPDTDNLLKGLCDAANKIVWNDDAAVVDMNCSKWYSANPRIEIEVSEWEVSA